MAQTKMTTIRLKIAELRPDPSQYKQYSPSFLPDELYLDVELPINMAQAGVPLEFSVGVGSLEISGDGMKTSVATRKVTPYVLTPDGYKYLLNYLATLVAEAHDERLKEMSRE